MERDKQGSHKSYICQTKCAALWFIFKATTAILPSIYFCTQSPMAAHILMLLHTLLRLTLLTSAAYLDGINTL